MLGKNSRQCISQEILVQFLEGINLYSEKEKRKKGSAKEGETKADEAQADSIAQQEAVALIYR